MPVQWLPAFTRMSGGMARRPRFPIALLTPAEMAEADRLFLSVMPGLALMRRAGTAVAQAALRLMDADGPRRVLVLCGPGNNGGDGYVVAHLLSKAGCDVAIAAIGRNALKGDAAQVADEWSGSTLALEDVDFEGRDLVVDALYGAGLTRELAGTVRNAVACLNAWSRSTGMPVLAVDIPSGIDGATGAVRDIAVNATATITFFRLKPGHVLMPGRIACGSLTLTDIGIDPCVLDTIAPKTLFNQPDLWLGTLPVPSLAGHKYGRGHVLVMSGPITQTGAARLCARGALRAGAGLVTMATPTEALPVHAAALTAIMTRIADDAEGLRTILADSRKNVVALGPGLGVGEGTRTLVLAALARSETDNAPPRSLVLDADALTSFADAPEILFDAIRTSGHSVVLTPHDGEFAKLFPDLTNDSGGKVGRTRAAALASGATIVLKGPDTVVASPDVRASIAASEAPWLATAGSGDVLGGMVAGLLAQAMPAFEAASAAVWMHAEAARLFGPGLIAEDIPDMLPRVLAGLYESDAIAGM